ncbi:kinase-like domain-containing protein [Dactylonectria estremocensis]|uniref:Kinase-like domain-containing protein n=1 Tax=Dactylonectria estremocensis TaxID=1079267 RepID=A0A9P9FLD1_9HYPO|nr:kinase-like domain-containing protein [Dactylonectria estremocensis]
MMSHQLTLLPPSPSPTPPNPPLSLQTFQHDGRPGPPTITVTFENQTVSSSPGSIEAIRQNSCPTPSEPNRTEADESLESLLRMHPREHFQSETQLWPYRFLKRIMTRERVLQALNSQEFQGIDNQNIEIYCDKIVPKERNILTGDVIQQTKSYTKIFAILILQDMGGCIGTFIEHLMSDDRLPLPNTNEPTRKRRPLTTTEEETLRCFKACGWKWSQIDSFCTYQRGVMVHFFGLDQNGKIQHYNIPPNTLLPWLKSTSGHVYDDGHRGGGFSDVKRYQIDEDSHGFHGLLKSVSLHDNCVAVKTLKKPRDFKDRNNWRKEVAMLLRFSGKDHRHLITLLATYTLDGLNHLLFPCAEYDLDEFWEARQGPMMNAGDIDLKLMRWVSNQIHGLMEAIKFIHDPHQQGLDVSMMYGKHGDLKPQNVLWFASPTEPMGILVITDLGLTDVHREESKSNIPNENVPLTPGYRPPECDIYKGKISRAFDIWTIGCLFLEMVCWLLGGQGMRAEFAASRMKMYITGSNSDIFFDIQFNKIKNGHVVMVKDKVTKWMQELHTNSGCTQFIHDLLEMIHDEMVIVLSPSQQRGKSDTLLRKITTMNKKAMDDQKTEYLVAPCPKEWQTISLPPVEVKLNPKAQEMISRLMPPLSSYSGITEEMTVEMFTNAQRD